MSAHGQHRSRPRGGGGIAVGKEKNIDPDFFREWFETFSQIPAAVSDGDILAMQKVWEFSKEMGILKEYPNAADVIWEHAIRE